LADSNVKADQLTSDEKKAAADKRVYDDALKKAQEFDAAEKKAVLKVIDARLNELTESRLNTVKRTSDAVTVVRQSVAKR
jgi:hypothetical protein